MPPAKSVVGDVVDVGSVVGDVVDAGSLAVVRGSPPFILNQSYA